MDKIYVSDWLKKEPIDLIYNLINVLVAPTGSGKSRAAFNVIIPALYNRQDDLHEKKRVLLLANRSILTVQHKSDAMQYFNSYMDMEETLEILSYQECAEKVRHQSKPTNFFMHYTAVVCDEAHFFISDMLFNPKHTIPLLAAILVGAIGLPKVFITATPDEFIPVLEREAYIVSAIKKDGLIGKRNYFVPIISRFPHPLDSESYSVHIVDTFEDLAIIFAAEAAKGEKSVLLLNDSTKNSEVKQLVQREAKDKIKICLLNASNKDDNVKFIESLARTGIMMADVLISTGVLENGVSMKDDKIKHLCVIADDKTTFLQMLGRVRIVNDEPVHIYFVREYEDKVENRRDYAQKCFDIAIEMEEQLKKIRNYQGEPFYEYGGLLDVGFMNVVEDVFTDPDSFVSKIKRTIFTLGWGENSGVDHFLSAEQRGAYLRGYKQNEYRIPIQEFGALFYNPYAISLYKEQYKLFEELLCTFDREGADGLISRKIAWFGKTLSDVLPDANNTWRNKVIADIRGIILQKKSFNYKTISILQKEVSPLARKLDSKRYFSSNQRKSVMITKEKLAVLCEDVGLVFEEKKTDGENIEYVIQEGGDSNG